MMGRQGYWSDYGGGLRQWVFRSSSLADHGVDR